VRKIAYLTLAAGMVLAAASTALAGQPIRTPEINPASLSAGLALLAGGVMLARARFRK